MDTTNQVQIIDRILKKLLTPIENYIFGYADLKCIPVDFIKFYPYGISIARRLDDSIVNKLQKEPTVEYYNHYHFINSELSKIGQKLHEELKLNHIESLIVEPTIMFSAPENKKYLDTLSVPISHKMVATRAGLGWIGKSGLLITPKFGPRIRLISILIKGSLEISTYPINQSFCGACRLCVDSCPAKAANGRTWNINVKREEFFDAFLCREGCRKRAEHLNLDIKLCAICVTICPHGK